MSTQPMPDSLVNVLIKNTKTGQVKRVIRDDGENGLHVSPPESPTLMSPISRDEFRNDWELHQTVNDQLNEGKRDPTEEQPFRSSNEGSGPVIKGVDLSSQMQLPSIDSRNGVNPMSDKNFGNLAKDPFAGRTSPTERLSAEEQAEYISTPAADATFSGQPVGGNEEPAELFDEQRADDEGMALAGEPENAEEQVREQQEEDKPAKKSSKK